MFDKCLLIRWSVAAFILFIRVIPETYTNTHTHTHTYIYIYIYIYMIWGYLASYFVFKIYFECLIIFGNNFLKKMFWPCEDFFHIPVSFIIFCGPFSLNSFFLKEDISFFICCVPKDVVFFASFEFSSIILRLLVSSLVLVLVHECRMDSGIVVR